MPVFKFFSVREGSPVVFSILAWCFSYLISVTFLMTFSPQVFPTHVSLVCCMLSQELGDTALSSSLSLLHYSSLYPSTLLTPRLPGPVLVRLLRRGSPPSSQSACPLVPVTAVALSAAFPHRPHTCAEV